MKRNILYKFYIKKKVQLYVNFSLFPSLPCSHPPVERSYCILQAGPKPTISCPCLSCLALQLLL